ncbi:MAG: AAA family ATPase [bacterium]|nr:AAA family ATPase [bacterium]
MKLIFIYGPPAVGKLTVAKILAEKTKFKLFHNHLTVDLVESIFTWGSPPFEYLNNQFRFEIFQKSVEEDINGIIFTYVYSHPEDLNFVNKVQKVIESLGGSVQFVQLIADKVELSKRVVHENRKEFNKVSSKEKLNGMLQKWNLFTPIPNVNNLIINNTFLNPDLVVDKIIEHYHLV